MMTITKKLTFNGETLTFILQRIKVSTIKRAFKNLKVRVLVLVEYIDQLHEKFMVI